MANLELANLFVNITARGIGGVAQALGSMKGSLAAFDDEAKRIQKSLDPIQTKLATIGSIGAKAFGLVASGLAAVAVASPRDFNRFTTEVTILIGQIGQFFIPLLRQLTGWLNNLNQWILHLDQNSKGLVGTFAKVALVLSVVVLVVPKLVSLFFAAAAAFKTFLVALDLMLATDPAGWVLVVAAAVGALVVALGSLSLMWVTTSQNTSGFLKEIGKLGSFLVGGIGGALSDVMKLVYALVDSFDAFLQGVGFNMDKVISIIQFLATPLTAFWTQQTSLAESGIAGWGRIFTVLLTIVQYIAEEIGKAFTAAFDTVTGVVNTLYDTFEGFFDMLSSYLGQANGWIKSFLEWLGKIPGLLKDLLPKDLQQKIEVSLDKYNKSLSKSKEDRKKNDSQQGMAAVEPSAFIGIAEMGRRVQTSAQASPTEKLLFEQRKLMEQQVELTKSIKENTKTDAFNAGATRQ